MYVLELTYEENHYSFKLLIPYLGVKGNDA